MRRRACPGAAGIGPTTYEIEELQHNYYDREAPSGFAGAQTLMVGMRWPVDFDWSRGQSRLNGRGGACHLRRRACPGAAGIGPTTCETEELQHNYL